MTEKERLLTQVRVIVAGHKESPDGPTRLGVAVLMSLTAALTDSDSELEAFARHCYQHTAKRVAVVGAAEPLSELARVEASLQQITLQHTDSTDNDVLGVMAILHCLLSVICCGGLIIREFGKIVHDYNVAHFARLKATNKPVNPRVN